MPPSWALGTALTAMFHGKHCGSGSCAAARERLRVPFALTAESKGGVGRAELWREEGERGTLGRVGNANQES